MSAKIQNFHNKFEKSAKKRNFYSFSLIFKDTYSDFFASFKTTTRSLSS